MLHMAEFRDEQHSPLDNSSVLYTYYTRIAITFILLLGLFRYYIQMFTVIELLLTYTASVSY